MMTVGYQRVSRRSPCGICGKPDWCSTTRDHRITFCARSATDADRISSSGWGVFYREIRHVPHPVYALQRKQPRSSKPNALAPVEIRDKVYKELIRFSPLFDHISLLSEEWVSPDQYLSRYGMLPKSAQRRQRLAQSIDDALAKKGARVRALRGVPGFWRTSNGRLQVGGNYDYADDLLLIPFIGSNGLIQACQLKAIGKNSRTSPKYSWLSSIRQRDGCGPGTPLHYEGALGFKGKTIETVLVTEGALKAATCQSFLPDRYVVGNSGVATSHREIVKAARKKALEIAFDADCFANPHVARALASLVASRVSEQQFLSCEQPTRILKWDKRLKGIDDALIAGATVHYLDVPEWLKLLTPECFDAASHQLAEISPSK